ncbi:centrosomal protein of 162 kDa isoform X2 [Pogoniulus pusillus]|uniref:centrosomal protein of 162 kDa isoform X2 n=1 Tax=Pogoniulus pusillus TaxID=488313 RepID=UPI0030B987B2
MAHRFSEEELDEQFEEFLKESLSDDSFGNSKKKPSVLDTLGQPRQKEAKKKDSVPWWIAEEDSVGGDSVLASGPNQGLVGVGLDTLEEQEEKEMFFAKLEQEASSTIDYSRLNKELDANDSALLAQLQWKEETAKGEGEAAHEEKSGSYSDDFEDETDSNPAFKTEGSLMNQNVDLSPQEQEEAAAGMLAKVVLLESQESTAELQKGIKTPNVALDEHYLPEEASGAEINEAGSSYGQSTTELEALHQAYHRVGQSLGDTDEQKLQDSGGAASECLVQSVPHSNDICLRNISTTESDLPTVEELMQPIKGHSFNIRSFPVEPESPVKLIESTANYLISHSALTEHQNNAVWEANSMEKSNREESNFLQRAVSDDNVQRASEKEIQSSEVQPDELREKTVQDSLLSQGSKAKQALHSHSLRHQRSGSVTTKAMLAKNIRSPTPLHNKKPSHGPHGLVRSSGYGKLTSPSKLAFPASEKKAPKETFQQSRAKGKSPADGSRSKEALFATRIIRPATNQPASKGSVPRALSGQAAVHNPGQQAVDCCKQYQHDLSFSPIKNCDRELYLLKRLQVAEEELCTANDLIQQLTSRVAQQEKELETKIVELKTEHGKELSQLGQENFILQSKLRSMEELTKEQKWAHQTAAAPATEKKLAQIQKEVEDQEVIIQGYQQENERLYKQVKELQSQNKRNEERMFKENQCLMSELIAIREKVEKTDNIQSWILRDSEPARNRSFTELISELRAAQKEEAKLQEEIRRLKQEKQALEVDLGQAKKERDLAKVQIASTSDEKSHEFKVMEESYKQEITHLKKRLQWYAENQDLLDRDAARLKDAKEEIEKLKLEVEKLRAEAGDQSVQQKKRLRDRAADARRIQDLERQIREMEGILRRRYPNSLPALIYAAAAAEKTDDPSAKANTVDFLERRIKKLERELEGKDDEAKKSLRTMEQQFQKIKIQYEQRLVELEQLLAYKFMSESPKLNGDKGSSTELEQELQKLKETHQVTVKNLQAEIEDLKSQNCQLKLRTKKDNKDLGPAGSPVKQRNTKDKLWKLNEELLSKNKEIQELTRTVEKLQKERMVLLSSNNLRTKPNHKESSAEILTKNSAAADKRHCSSSSEPLGSGFKGDRMHQAQSFAGSELSEVLQENAGLKEELERLSLEMKQQRVKAQAALAYSESNIRRIQEDTAEYIASLKAAHQREVEQILCQHAKEHSASKVAQLNSRISTQEVLIKHLQEQMGDQQRHQEALLVSQMREELLQKEVTKLLEELREAKERQSPEMKHFLCLERKIKHIETRQAEREQHIQQAAQVTQQLTGARQSQEVERWRRFAQQKNQELERFRVELDSILDVLKELQKQGVVIPAPSSTGFSVADSCWKT